MHASLRNRALLLICHVALLGLVSGASASEASASVGRSCGKQALARDFLQPLKRVAPINSPPQEGRLPFGPKGLRLEKYLGGGLVTGGGWVGFEFFDDTSEHWGHLNWIIESELSRVSARGRVLSSLDVKRQRIGPQTRNLKSFLHRVSGNPAYYRVDIRFSRLGTGRLLGEYSHYARVMKRQVKLRVAVDNPAVLPGTLVKARLINLGTVPFKALSFQDKFVVQRFTGETWTLVPDNPPREEREGPIIKVIQRLGPGMELRGCLRYLVPKDQAPGLFRFISFGRDGEPLVAARFRVRAP